MKIFETDGGFVRKSLRGTTINYRWGWFFVSFNCAQNKSVLGSIVGEEVSLNELGRRVAKSIAEMGRFYPEVYVDTFVIMPNHVHFIIKIEDRPSNDKNHLGQLVRKLKTFTATIYRKMKASGEISDFGIDGLWQTDFWEVIVTNYDQLEAYRKYIRENPKNCSRDRFGAVTTYSRGNLTLLEQRFIAFVASEGDARSERAVLRRLLAKGRRIIAVYPGGIPYESELPRDLYAALLEGRALLISPAAPKTGLNKQRANWCNEYILRNDGESDIECGGGNMIEFVFIKVYARTDYRG